MRHGVLFLVLGLVAAALGAASAYAAGTTATSSTTATTTTTTSTTTTATTATATTSTGATTTTPPPPTFSLLTPAYLSGGCVGAGAAAIAVPGRPVLTLGTPAANRGPSFYPAKAPIVRFLSSTASGSSCKTARVALGSVSLFGGVVTARTVAATHGKGVVSGFRIYGSPVALRAGRPVRIAGWGEVTLEKTVGRLTAPLVATLLVAHHTLPAGTTIAFAFGASPRIDRKAKTAANGLQRQARTASETKKQREPAKPPPDFPATPSPLAKGGGLTDAAQDNPVVLAAMQYLGVPYQWGGASPATGFDCSGLVKYVFARFGVPLVHYAAAQWHTPYGVWVAPNRLQPGDLVFFTGSDGTRKAPGHVGIYVDDGYFIDAPHTGTFVRIDSLTEPKFANQYVGARKIDSQLIVARHLLHVNRPNPSATALQLGFRSPIGPLGESFGVAAPSVAGVWAPSRGFWIWVGALSGGVLLLFVAGGLLACRLRSPGATSRGEASN
jgi:cell wall-associated NlpC family hydrolase